MQQIPQLQRYKLRKTTRAQAASGFSRGWRGPALKVAWSPGLMLDGKHAVGTQQGAWGTLIHQACS